MGNQPVEQTGEQETDNVAAGGAEQNADAAGKAGEYRNAHGSQYNIDQNGNGAALAAQCGEGTEHGKGLHGERHGHGNLDP